MGKWKQIARCCMDGYGKHKLININKNFKFKEWLKWKIQQQLTFI